MAINNSYQERRRNDIAKLNELQAKAPRLIKIISASGEPPNLISLRFNIPTAKNANFPKDKQDFSEVIIALNEKYPFEPGPMVHFKTPIWNPNVYHSNKYCYGKWTPTENMYLFVARLMKVIALDSTIIHPDDAANKEAAIWYKKILSSNPELFPTIRLDNLTTEIAKPKISWRTIE